MAEREGSETDARSTASRPVLNSWKEIAGYFQIDVRTCQRWEKSSGLPVHRMDHSSRSRVIAYPDELDRWRSQVYKAKSPEPVETPERESGIRRWRVPLIFGAVLLSAAAIAAGVIFSDRVPDGFRIRGSRLIVTNRYGLRLWPAEGGVADLAPTPAYRSRFQNKTYLPYQGGELACFPWLIIRDLDGDGKKEVLWIPRHAEEQPGDMDTLVLLDQSGRERWRFDPGREIVIGGRAYAPNFVINILEAGDFDGDGRNEILLAAHSYGESPTRIVLLDLGKNVRGEFWNYGQLADMAFGDIDGDSRPEFVFAGQNNDGDGPALIALDPNDIRGGSPFGGNAGAATWTSGTEKMYAVFPTLEIDRLRVERSSFQSLRLQANRHFLAQTTSVLRLDIAPGLKLPQVIPTDAFKTACRAAYRAGQISRPYDKDRIIAEFSGQSRYFDGTGWTPDPVFVRRAAASPSPGGAPPRSIERK